MRHVFADHPLAGWVGSLAGAPRLSVEAEFASTIVEWRIVEWSGSDGHEEGAGGGECQEESDELDGNGAAGGAVQNPGLTGTQE